MVPFGKKWKKQINVKKRVERKNFNPRILKKKARKNLKENPPCQVFYADLKMRLKSISVFQDRKN